MNCRGIQQRLSLYLDDELGGDELLSLKEHLEKCPACMEYYRSLKATKQYCRALKYVELPLGFHDRLYRKLIKERRKKMLGKFGYRIGIGIAAALVLVFIGTSLSDRIGFDSLGLRRQAQDMSTADMAAPLSDRVEEPSINVAFSEERAAPVRSAADENIIQTAYLSIEVLEYDSFVNIINDKLSSLGGYIESFSVEELPCNAEDKPLRKAAFQIRLPNEHFQQFIIDIGEIANILTKQEDILELEEDLSKTCNEIESLTDRPQKWDNMVEYSSIALDVYEVKK